MNILYDHQMFSRQKYGGITKYFCELIKHQVKPYNFRLSVLLTNNQHLKDDNQFFKKLYFPLPEEDSRIRGQLKSKIYKINDLYSRYRIVSNNYDILHPTYYSSYFINLTKKPFIITVHDLIYFKYEEFYHRKVEMEEMKEVIAKASRIIAISENTKKDLIEILKVPDSKIDVIYHGFNRVKTSRKENKYGRYILYVGARAGYKNFSNLLKAFKIISTNDKDLKLICVGSPFSKEEINELHNLGIVRNLLIMGVNETKLNQLYSCALAFLYPTKYEGFGMSILEAFANNCPVCLSNTSCLPEIAGDAGLYFDPYQVEDIAQKIKKLIYDTELSKKMTILGQKRLQNFSWKKCASETAKSYERALS